MAGFTDAGCCYVRTTLANGRRTIVTTEAGAIHLHMINRRWQHHPVIDRVATVTETGGGDMQCGLAGGDDSIVAGTTSPQYVSMIDCTW